MKASRFAICFNHLFDKFFFKLMQSILKEVDPELYSYLESKGLKAEIYGMPCILQDENQLVQFLFFLDNEAILSLSACTPPLEELLKLWDFFFAFGVHL